MPRQILLALLLLTGAAADVRPLPNRVGAARANARAVSPREPTTPLGAVAVRGGDASGESNLRGVVSILGGMLSHLALGTLYCWGNFITYAPRSLLFFDGKAAGGRSPDALFVLPGSIIFQTVGLNIGARLNEKIGVQGAALTGGLLFALAVYLSSFQTRLVPFMLCYSVLFGTGIGTAYTAPMVAGWSWFPNCKGVVNGCVLAAFGSGGFFGNKIGSALVNPLKLKADPATGALPAEVYANFPKMLRTLSMGYAVLAVAGSSLIKKKPAAAGAQAGKASAGSAGLTCGQAVRTAEFWLLFAMFCLSASAGLNTASVYKSFGVTIPELNDDVFQSLMGGLGALSNGLGRIFWASMVDFFGFTKPYGTMVTLQAIVMGLFTKLARSRTTFAFAICAVFFCLGGNFAMAPTVTAAIFGSGQAAQIYSVLFSAFAAAAISGTYVTKALLGFGWGTVFNSMAVASLIAFGLNTQLRK